jgi:hypothetical protein
MTSIIFDCLEKTFQKLVQLKHEGEPRPASSPSLLFPVKSLSEHEARLLFSIELLKKNIPFSIETPTIKTYGKQKGHLDLCVYDEKGKRRDNMEFKANKSGRARRDFDKLLNEEGNGHLVHILCPSTGNTLEQLHKKYLDRMGTRKTKNNLFFYVCALDTKTLYTRRLKPGNSAKDLPPISTWEAQG